MESPSDGKKTPRFSPGSVAMQDLGRSQHLFSGLLFDIILCYIMWLIYYFCPFDPTIIQKISNSTIYTLTECPGYVTGYFTAFILVVVVQRMFFPLYSLNLGHLMWHFECDENEIDSTATLDQAAFIVGKFYKRQKKRFHLVAAVCSVILINSSYLAVTLSQGLTVADRLNVPINNLWTYNTFCPTLKTTVTKMDSACICEFDDNLMSTVVSLVVQKFDSQYDVFKKFNNAYTGEWTLHDLGQFSVHFDNFLSLSNSLKEMFASLDKNKNGRISLDEFEQIAMDDNFGYTKILSYQTVAAVKKDLGML